MKHSHSRKVESSSLILTNKIPNPPSSSQPPDNLESSSNPAPDIAAQQQPELIQVDSPQKTASPPVPEPSLAPSQSPAPADTPPPFRPSWPQQPLLIVGAIVLTVGCLMGGRWWQFQRTHITTDNAQIKGHLAPIAPKVTAEVKQVLVKDGDYVQPGQLLVLLEDPDLPLKVQQAEATLALAQAQLQSAKDTLPLTSQTNQAQVQQSQANLSGRESAGDVSQAGVDQAQATVRTNQARVTQAQAEVTKTQADLRRYQALYQEGAVPAQQLDTAKAAFENAQANLEATKQMVAESQAEVRSMNATVQKSRADIEVAQGQLAQTQVSGQQLVVQQDQVRQAEAQVKQAIANLALARQQLQYTLIKAPMSGYVGNVTAQVGQQVQPDQPLLSLVPLQSDQLYVEANFKETALKNLRVGQAAEVEVDAYPGQAFPATIAGISPATGANFALLPPENATGNYNKVVQWLPVRLVFQPNADPQHKLRAGLSVKVTVDASLPDLSLPRGAATTLPHG